MARVLITGGGGFLGCAIAEAHAFEVYNVATGQAPLARRDRGDRA